MQLLLFVVDKVDTCLRLDIDELLLIGPEIEHLVSKIIQNYKRNSIGCMKNVWTQCSMTVHQILSIALPQVACNFI